MAHFVEKRHFAYKQKLDRMESAIMLGVIGGGLMACAVGAFVYDIGKAFSVW